MAANKEDVQNLTRSTYRVVIPHW